MSKTATLSPSVTAVEPDEPVKLCEPAEPIEARPVHIFRGGPLGGLKYSHWRECPLDHGGTALLIVPFGVDLGTAIAWGLADFRYSEGGYASVVGKAAVYRQTGLHAWEYVPPMPSAGGYHKG